MRVVDLSGRRFFLACSPMNKENTMSLLRGAQTLAYAKSNPIGKSRQQQQQQFILLTSLPPTLPEQQVWYPEHRRPDLVAMEK